MISCFFNCITITFRVFRSFVWQRKFFVPFCNIIGHIGVYIVHTALQIEMSLNTISIHSAIRTTDSLSPELTTGDFTFRLCGYSTLGLLSCHTNPISCGTGSRCFIGTSINNSCCCIRIVTETISGNICRSGSGSRNISFGCLQEDRI